MRFRHDLPLLGARTIPPQTNRKMPSWVYCLQRLIDIIPLSLAKRSGVTVKLTPRILFDDKQKYSAKEPGLPKMLCPWEHLACVC